MSGIARRLAGALASAATAASLWLGCTIWNDAMLPVKPVGSSSGTTPPDDSGDATDAGCKRAVVDGVGPPAVEGTGGDIDFVMAVKSISLGLDAGKVIPDFGYDLDHSCTNSCVPRVKDGGAKEGELGRDHGTGDVAATLVFDPSSYANESFLTGGIGILARVRNYNGMANDDGILFSLYRSSGVDGTPNFDDPDQEWKIDPTDLKNGTSDYTSLNESAGFVRDHMLVVPNLDSSKIPFNVDSDILLKRVSFTGEVFMQGDGHWNVRNAIGVGRWGLTDAVETIARVKDPQGKSDDDRLCKNPVLFGLARTIVCNGADISLTPESDNTGATCNAISAAVGFTTFPAKLGATVEPIRKDACEGIPSGGCD